MAMYILPALTTYGQPDTPWYSPFGFAASAVLGCFTAILFTFSPSLVTGRVESSSRAIRILKSRVEALEVLALKGLGEERNGDAYNDTRMLAISVKLEQARKNLKVQQNAAQLEPCFAAGGEVQRGADELWGCCAFEAAGHKLTRLNARRRTTDKHREGLIEAVLSGGGVARELEKFKAVNAADACLKAYAKSRMDSTAPPSRPPLLPLPSRVLGPFKLSALKPLLKISLSSSVGTLFVVVPKLDELSEHQGYLVGEPAHALARRRRGEANNVIGVRTALCVLDGSIVHAPDTRVTGRLPANRSQRRFLTSINTQTLLRDFRERSFSFEHRNTVPGAVGYW